MEKISYMLSVEENTYISAGWNHSKAYKVFILNICQYCFDNFAVLLTTTADHLSFKSLFEIQKGKDWVVALTAFWDASYQHWWSENYRTGSKIRLDIAPSVMSDIEWQHQHQWPDYHPDEVLWLYMLVSAMLDIDWQHQHRWPDYHPDKVLWLYMLLSAMLDIDWQHQHRWSDYNSD